MRSSADHLGPRGFGTFRNLGLGLVGALIDVGLQRAAPHVTGNDWSSLHCAFRAGLTANWNRRACSNVSGYLTLKWRRCSGPS